MNVKTNEPNITIGLKDIRFLQSTKGCKLKLSTFPEDSKKVYILPGLACSYFLSIGTMCDARFKAEFYKINLCMKNTINLTHWK